MGTEKILLEIEEKYSALVKKFLEKEKIKYTISSSNESEEDFIPIPSIGLEIAKKISPLGKNWYETYEAFAEDDSRMLTIPEYIVFLNYLRDTRIYEEIIQSEEWRLEYLDAYFEEGEEGLYVLTENQSNFERTEEGIHMLKDEAKANAEKLENALLGKEEFYEISLKSWLKNPTPQGLPISDFKKPRSDKDKVIYYPPQEGCVAGIEVSSDSFTLDCRINPFEIESGPSSGSRAAKPLR